MYENSRAARQFTDDLDVRNSSYFKRSILFDGYIFSIGSENAVCLVCILHDKMLVCSSAVELNFW